MTQSFNIHIIFSIFTSDVCLYMFQQLHDFVATKITSSPLLHHMDDTLEYYNMDSYVNCAQTIICYILTHAAIK